MTATQLSLLLQALTLVAVLLAAWQLLFHSRQMHRDFEMLYVQRYWEVMDRRSESFVLDAEPTHSDRVVIRAYLQLCEDEIDLRRIGRVTDSTWRFWAGAILDQCSGSAYATELATADHDAYARLREHLASKGTADPMGHTWLWRKFHGL